MKKTNIIPVDGVFTFTNRFGKEISFTFYDVVCLDIMIRIHDEPDISHIDGVYIMETDDFPLALPVRTNMNNGELVSIDVLEYND